MEWRDRVVGDKGGYRVKWINEIVAEIGGIFGLLCITRNVTLCENGDIKFIYFSKLIENE